jgi:maltose O-acetyltransferase
LDDSSEGLVLSWLRHVLRHRYINNLVRRGLQLGKDVYLNDGFFIDPSHCHLVSIGDRAVFGPSVTILAHDASSLKLIGKTKIQAVRVGREAFVGARAVLLPGSEVGDGSVLGAGSLLLARIPAGEVWAGNPARRICSVAEYTNKLMELDGVDFAESRYEIGLLDEQRRQEMVSQVTLDRPGFMIDR